MNKIFFSTIFLFLLYPVLAFCQAPDTLWTREYGGIEYNDARSVIQTNDNCFCATGSSGADVYIFKIDEDGSLVWEKTHHVSYLGVDRGYCIRQTFDGGYIVVVTTYPPFEDRYVCLLKTNANGDTIWTRRRLSSYYFDSGYAIEQTADSGYIVVGTADGFLPMFDIVHLIKTDADGILVWERIYTYTQDYIYGGQSVRQTEDLGYIITGFKSPFYYYNPDVYLLKTDSYGDTVWSRTYGGEQGECGNCVQITSDGGYIIVGVTESFGAGNLDVYLIKTDIDGDTLWIRTYGGTGDDAGMSVEEISDGGYLIAGYTNSFGEGEYDYFILKTYSNGDINWMLTCGGQNDDKGLSAIEIANGGYIIAGYTNSFDEDNYDAYLIRLESDQTGIDSPDIRMHPYRYILTQNYPNPFNPTTTITFSLPEARYVTLKVYDLLGREVQTLVEEKKPAGTHTVDFDASELSSGVYFYRLQAGDFSETNKMILLK